MGQFNVNTLNNGNTSRDEPLCATSHDTSLPLGPAADFTGRHPKSVLHVRTCQSVEIHTDLGLTWLRANMTPGHRPRRDTDEKP